MALGWLAAKAHDSAEMRRRKYLMAKKAGWRPRRNAKPPVALFNNEMAHLSIISNGNQYRRNLWL